jgi:hypothetical protein
MTIWIAILIACALMAAAGFFLGAVRATVLLLGAFLGGLLAMSLGPTVKPLLTMCGVKSVVWLWLLPPVLAYVLVFLVALGLSFVAYLPIAKYLKFRAGDIERQLFERLNQRCGAAVGILTGTVLVFWMGLAIYVPGYFTAQFANEADPAWLKLLNTARQDMHTTGFDRLVSRFDPAPKKFYEVTDILGLLYHNNPAVLQRLEDYPPFMNLSERQDLKDMAGDKEFMEALQGKASLADLIKHPRIEGVINAGDLTQQLFAVDLKDFRVYLEKGTSAIYDPIKILGRWELDSDQVVINTRKRHPNITSKELRALRAVLATMAEGTQLKVTTDNKFTLTTKGLIMDVQKMTEQMQARQAAAAPRAGNRGLGVAPSALAPAVRQFTGRMAARYGQPAQPAPQQPAVAAPADGEPVPLKMETKTYEGTWEGDGESYTIKVKDEKGNETSSDGFIEGDYLVVTLFGQQLFFVRQA